jgi:hypothetical protein
MGAQVTAGDGGWPWGGESVSRWMDILVRPVICQPLPPLPPLLLLSSSSSSLSSSLLLFYGQEPSQDRERVFRELFCAGVAVIHGVWVSQPRHEKDIMCVSACARAAVCLAAVPA